MNELGQLKQTGVVKWFSRLKGYGFILPDNGGQDVFAHYSAISGEGYRNLSQGDRVEYVLLDKGKGPQAADIATMSEQPMMGEPIMMSEQRVIREQPMVAEPMMAMAV